MQYIVKSIMISLSNMVLGGFAGMLIRIFYGMMIGETQTVIGIVGFLGMIAACIVYSILVKKFVIGQDISSTIPNIFLAAGVWIGWSYFIYV